MNSVERLKEKHSLKKNNKRKGAKVYRYWGYDTMVSIWRAERDTLSEFGPGWRKQIKSLTFRLCRSTVHLKNSNSYCRCLHNQRHIFIHSLIYRVVYLFVFGDKWRCYPVTRPKRMGLVISGFTNIKQCYKFLLRFCKLITNCSHIA